MSAPLPDHPTIVLIERAQADDDQAMQVLFERFLPRVKRIVAIRLGRGIGEILDVEDVVQEAMVDAFRGLRTFDVGSDGRLCGWLSKVVENRIRMALREGRAKKRGGGKVRRFADATETFHQSAVPGNVATPSENAVGSELGDRIEAGLKQLGERQREVIIHRFFCNMSYDEIAAEMGLTGADSARALYSKALRQLGSSVQPGEAGG